MSVRNAIFAVSLAGTLGSAVAFVLVAGRVASWLIATCGAPVVGLGSIVGMTGFGFFLYLTAPQPGETW
jgi:hypothetical protein